jgi:hypothetical protein
LASTSAVLALLLAGAALLGPRQALSEVCPRAERGFVQLNVAADGLTTLGFRS